MLKSKKIKSVLLSAVFSLTLFSCSSQLYGISPISTNSTNSQFVTSTEEVLWFEKFNLDGTILTKDINGNQITFDIFGNFSTKKFNTKYSGYCEKLFNDRNNIKSFVIYYNPLPGITDGLINLVGDISGHMVASECEGFKFVKLRFFSK